MLAIAWQYLVGRAVATDPSDRQATEWPPHPDRVFQALVAAWGERGGDALERAALEWLEVLGPPELAVPELAEAAFSRGQTYVPVNDTAGPNRGDYQARQMALLPCCRDRKERWFPAVWVGDATCAMLWQGAVPSEQNRAGLAALCAAVTHVGHSRSLVRMWLTDTPPPCTWRPEPQPRRSELHVRIPHPGRLAALAAAYAGGGTGWQRPPMAYWQGYTRCGADLAPPHTPHDPRLLILRRTASEGRPGLVQAPAFVAALRGALMAKAGPRALPWISGHAPDGAAFEKTHVGWIPLAYVGSEHADGHLLGIAMALPRDLQPDDEQAIFDALADAMDPATGELHLNAGNAGTMDLTQEERPAPPFALRGRSWTGPAVWWGSITPIALDRLPPRRHQGDAAWVAEQVSQACERQGLPVPCDVRTLPVSPCIGAPTARAFPALRRKPDGARRWHVHAALRFPQPVEGPMLLGAGRYRGYGVCRPLSEDLPPRRIGNPMPLDRTAMAFPPEAQG